MWVAVLMNLLLIDVHGYVQPKTDDVDGTPLDLDGDPIEDVDGEPLDPEVTRRRKEREQRHKERDMRERL